MSYLSMSLVYENENHDIIYFRGRGFTKPFLAFNNCDILLKDGYLIDKKLVEDGNYMIKAEGKLFTPSDFFFYLKREAKSIYNACVYKDILYGRHKQSEVLEVVCKNIQPVDLEIKKCLQIERLEEKVTTDYVQTNNICDTFISINTYDFPIPYYRFYMDWLEVGKKLSDLTSMTIRTYDSAYKIKIINLNRLQSILTKLQFMKEDGRVSVVNSNLRGAKYDDDDNYFISSVNGMTRHQMKSIILGTRYGIGNKKLGSQSNGNSLLQHAINVSDEDSNVANNYFIDAHKKP